MKDKIYGVFSFSSPHYAIAAEQATNGVGASRSIPVPPEISAGCGLALRVEIEAVQEATNILKEKEIPFEQVNKLEIKDKKRIVSEI